MALTAHFLETGTANDGLAHVSGDTWVDVNSLFSYYNEVYFGRKLGGTTQSGRLQ